jgi:hypothetical protein
LERTGDYVVKEVSDHESAAAFACRYRTNGLTEPAGADIRNSASRGLR